MKRFRLAIAAFGCLGACAGALAHHSIAMFDNDNSATLTGTVQAFTWQNPHCMLVLDTATVTNAAGQAEPDKAGVWSVELHSTAIMMRRGFTKDFLKPGTELVIEGFMAKGVPRRANARLMTYPDGRKLFVGSSGTGAPADGLDPSEKP